MPFDEVPVPVPVPVPVSLSSEVMLSASGRSDRVVGGRGDTLLSVRDLTVAVGPGGDLAVDGVSFDLRRGEILGIVGESGSGKTLTAMAAARLLPEPAARVTGGTILFDGRDVLSLSWSELTALRGSGIGVVFQDPLSSLNPVLTIGKQIEEQINAHSDLSREAVRRRAVELLERVGIPSPATRMRSYPHEFSGGMRQRVMIAMALSCNPQLLIADEPTTAVDVTVQAEILALLKDLQQEFEMAALFISHDLQVVVSLCDRIAVMYAGRIVESAPSGVLYNRPLHPYTIGLMASDPRIDKKVARLQAIPGSPPSLGMRPTGCSFNPRCQWAHSSCYTVPDLNPRAEGHSVACWLDSPPRTHAGPKDADEGPTSDGSHPRGAALPPAPLLAVENLRVVYSSRSGGQTLAVDGVSFEVHAGQTVALVGESGSGKSSLAKGIARLAPITGGEVRINGTPLSTMPGSGLRKIRRSVSLVFQDPYSSLNPKWRVRDILTEPLRIHGIGTKEERIHRVGEALSAVELSEEALARYPSDFSGGQRQRIGIARALVLDPQLIICDEPVSSLDVSIQAQILNLIAELRESLGIAFLLISHDLSVVRHLADEVHVMFAGRVVESGPSEDLFEKPVHSYTRQLLASVPSAVQSATAGPHPSKDSGVESL